MSQSGLYAIRAAAALARLPAGACAGAGRVAEAAGIPPSDLVKVLQSLARAGVVASRKGPGGGFRLSRPRVAPADDPRRLRRGRVERAGRGVPFDRHETAPTETPVKT
jgi:hypothetical protein